MRRGIWFVAGAGAGVYVMVKARRAAEAFTPEGLRDRLSGLTTGAQLFGDEVRAGMAEKETELRTRLGLGVHGTPELVSSTSTGATTPASSTDTASSTTADTDKDAH